MSPLRTHGREQRAVSETTAIPIDRFGRDHWSALLYIETRCTDHRGVLYKPHMRCNQARHPFLAHEIDGTSPTRLANGELLHDHDDWDCADDLVGAGLIEWNGTGVHPVFAMTDAGREKCAALRKERQERAK